MPHTPKILIRQRVGSNTKEVVAPEAFEKQMAEIRKYGLSRTLGQPIPGIDALCAPVFDTAGHLELAIMVMGPSSNFDSDWNGSIASLLRDCTKKISARLGVQ